ncbi:MAG: type II toxin-antitoxin system HicA family toxin [Candidatus Sedimenticola sp. (ex Thyasira tokunagai)]
MNHKQKHTLQALFKEPVSGNLHWRDIESLLRSLGVELQSGHGARIGLLFNGVEGSFHRPHHSGVSSKQEIRHLRQFLISAGIQSP